jgi:hypothetical protein
MRGNGLKEYRLTMELTSEMSKKITKVYENDFWETIAFQVTGSIST